MPTVAVVPSIFAHSCSLVYLRSCGRFTIRLHARDRDRGAAFLSRAFVKGHRRDYAAVPLTADLDIESRADRACALAHQRGGDILAAERRRGRAATHFADTF